MSKIDIRDYMWDIFKIGVEEDVDTGVACDMFVANIRNHADPELPHYGKGVELDYAKIAEEIGDMSAVSLHAFKMPYIRANYTYRKELAEPWNAGDREKFTEIAKGDIPQWVIDLVG